MVHDHTLTIDVNGLYKAVPIDEVTMATTREEPRTAMGTPLVEQEDNLILAKVRPALDDKNVISLQVYAAEKVLDCRQENRRSIYRVQL